MLSSLLRIKKGRKRVAEHSPFSSPYTPLVTPTDRRRRRGGTRQTAADSTQSEDDAEESEEDDEGGEHGGDGPEEEEREGEDEGEDGHGQGTPLLPIFSAAHLGKQWYTSV